MGQSGGDAQAAQGAWKAQAGQRAGRRSEPRPAGVLVFQMPDQIAYLQDGHRVRLGEGENFGQAGHGAVGVGQFAQDAVGRQGA